MTRDIMKGEAKGRDYAYAHKQAEKTRMPTLLVVKKLDDNRNKVCCEDNKH